MPIRRRRMRVAAPKFRLTLNSPGVLTYPVSMCKRPRGLKLQPDALSSNCGAPFQIGAASFVAGIYPRLPATALHRTNRASWNGICRAELKPGFFRALAISIWRQLRVLDSGEVDPRHEWLKHHARHPIDRGNNLFGWQYLALALSAAIDDCCAGQPTSRSNLSQWF